jgi:hypothetical protein
MGVSYQPAGILVKKSCDVATITADHELGIDNDDEASRGALPPMKLVNHKFSVGLAFKVC